MATAKPVHNAAGVHSSVPKGKCVCVVWLDAYMKNTTALLRKECELIAWANTGLQPACLSRTQCVLISHPIQPGRRALPGCLTSNRAHRRLVWKLLVKSPLSSDGSMLPKKGFVHALRFLTRVLWLLRLSKALKKYNVQQHWILKKEPTPWCLGLRSFQALINWDWILISRCSFVNEKAIHFFLFFSLLFKCTSFFFQLVLLVHPSEWSPFYATDTSLALSIAQDHQMSFWLQ